MWPGILQRFQVNLKVWVHKSQRPTSGPLIAIPNHCLRAAIQAHRRCYLNQEDAVHGSEPPESGPRRCPAHQHSRVATASIFRLLSYSFLDELRSALKIVLLLNSFDLVSRSQDETVMAKLTHHLSHIISVPSSRHLPVRYCPEWRCSPPSMMRLAAARQVGFSRRFEPRLRLP